MHPRWILAGVVVGIGIAAGLATYVSRDEGGSGPASGSTKIPQATAAELGAANLDLPLAPRSKRVDLVAPLFSDPTKVTNPLFPISNLSSAILSGRVDGKPFKTETTLLPRTRILQWPDGDRTEALVSQYVAYLGGRIKEVALDFYAQADDGSVWYLGEDVFNYENGVIVDTAGTWHAGEEGPAALIMPAKPRVGDVYRPENIPGLVFEEVRVKAVDRTVAGPKGPVAGAIIAGELHQDGSREDKVFAPGYGEFSTASGGDVEAMTLAMPADELPGPSPAELETLSAGADRVFEAASKRRWKRASATLRTMIRAWRTLQRGEVPPRLDARMSLALKELGRVVAARDTAQALRAAIAVAQGSLDLQLRHRPPTEIDRARFELWARQLVVDAAAEDAAGVRGDLATLEWIRDRFVHTLDRVGIIRVNSHLVELRTHVSDHALGRAAREAERLQSTLSVLRPVCDQAPTRASRPMRRPSAASVS